jgi:hypothetical protein
MRNIEEKLFRNWQSIMDRLWTTLKNTYPKNVEIDGQKGIVWRTETRGELRITVNIVNNAYLTANVYKDNVELMEARFDGNVNTIVSLAVLWGLDV